MSGSSGVDMMAMTVVMVWRRQPVPAKPETLRRLRLYKIGGTTYDEVSNDLVDDGPPEMFVREHVRRLREEPDIPWSTVRKRLRRTVVIRLPSVPRS